VGDHWVLAELRDRKGDSLIEGFGLDMSEVAYTFGVLERNGTTRHGHAEHYSAIFAFYSLSRRGQNCTSEVANVKMPAMNMTEIVRQLQAERDKLDAAIRALEGVAGGGSASGRRRGRPRGSSNKPASASAGRKRQMSAAARKRIAEAMRQRWAAAKKSGKKRL
jgi:hypothetical protein